MVLFSTPNKTAQLWLSGAMLASGFFGIFVAEKLRQHAREVVKHRALTAGEEEVEERYSEEIVQGTSGHARQLNKLWSAQNDFVRTYIPATVCAAVAAHRYDNNTVGFCVGSFCVTSIWNVCDQYQKCVDGRYNERSTVRQHMNMSLAMLYSLATSALIEESLPAGSGEGVVRELAESFKSWFVKSPRAGCTHCQNRP